MAEPEKKAEASGQKVAGYIGLIAFFVGVILAIISGIIARDNGGIVLALLILGIIVGVLNITAKEVLPLLIAAIALIVVGKGGFAPLDNLLKGLGSGIDGIVSYFATFMTPAAVISSIRAIWVIAKPGD